jgi:transcriptional regulator with XRE-family HTH domain
MKTPIPNTLKECRKQAGLRQMDVANIMGFHSIDRICRWEKGRTYPHLRNLFKLSKLYGVKPEQLYGELLETLQVDENKLPEEKQLKFT